MVRKLIKLGSLRSLDPGRIKRWIFRKRGGGTPIRKILLQKAQHSFPKRGRGEGGTQRPFEFFLKIYPILGTEVSQRSGDNTIVSSLLAHSRLLLRRLEKSLLFVCCVAFSRRHFTSTYPRIMANMIFRRTKTNKMWNPDCSSYIHSSVFSSGTKKPGLNLKP